MKALFAIVVVLTFSGCVEVSQDRAADLSIFTVRFVVGDQANGAQLSPSVEYHFPDTIYKNSNGTTVLLTELTNSGYSTVTWLDYTDNTGTISVGAEGYESVLIAPDEIMKISTIKSGFGPPKSLDIQLKKTE